MEDIVESQLERLLAKREDVCKCKKCRLDISALVLNKFFSKYIVSQKGRAYTRLLDLELQLKADVAKEITRAIILIKANPQH